MRLGLVALMLAAVGVLGCGSDEKRQEEWTQDYFALGCPNPPVEKFIPSSDPVPNSWIIVFVNGTPVRATGDALAEKYGGTVTHYYEAVLGGVAMSIGEDAARQISTEPVVCWVEQDGYVHGN